jgi:hypothetical protein
VPRFGKDHAAAWRNYGIVRAKAWISMFMDLILFFGSFGHFVAVSTLVMISVFFSYLSYFTIISLPLYHLSSSSTYFSESVQCHTIATCNTRESSINPYSAQRRSQAILLHHPTRSLARIRSPRTTSAHSKISAAPAPHARRQIHDRGAGTQPLSPTEPSLTV